MHYALIFQYFTAIYNQVNQWLRQYEQSGASTQNWPQLFDLSLKFMKQPWTQPAGLSWEFWMKQHRSLARWCDPDALPDQLPTAGFKTVESQIQAIKIKSMVTHSYTHTLPLDHSYDPDKAVHTSFRSYFQAITLVSMSPQKLWGMLQNRFMARHLFSDIPWRHIL